MLAFMLVASLVAPMPPIGDGGAASALAPTATIGGSIWAGSNDGTGPNLTPEPADAIVGASVMVQNQHSGGAFITYGTVVGNTWTATVPAPGDYVVMFSAPGYDLTSREFTVQEGDSQSKDAFLAPAPVPTASLLFYAFYDNYINGEDDAPDDPAMNGITVTVTDKDGVELATGLTGSQRTITLADGTVKTETDGLYYFTGLPAGQVFVSSDASTAWSSPQPTDPVTAAPLGAGWDASTEFHLMTSEEGGTTWELSLYPGDPGTEMGGYMLWHGYVERLGQIGSPGNPVPFNPLLAGSISGTMLDADGGVIDPLEPFPVPGQDHPGVSLNVTVPDGFVILYTDTETVRVHAVATTLADSSGNYEFVNVPPGPYKLFFSDTSIDYVWMQRQIRVSPAQEAVVNPLVPRFFARAQGYVYDDSTGLPIAGAVVHIRFKSGAIEMTTQTDADGWYNFDDLPEIEVLGHVDVEPPVGYRGAIKTETFYPGGTNPSHPNYALRPPIDVTSNSMNRYLQWYTANYRADFHLEPVPASTGDIAGFVWNENLASGTWTVDGVYQPTDERTLHGVTVELWNSAGTTLLDSTTTGKVNQTDLEAQGWMPAYTMPIDEFGGVFAGPMPGFYEFRDLAPGNYELRMILPDGYSASPVGSDTIAVTVSIGAQIEENFGANTMVPQAGEIEGGVFDDVFVDNNSLSLLFLEKAGIPGAPVGVYDHLGYFLGSGVMGNPLCYSGSPPGSCPVGETPVQKPEIERRFAPGVHIFMGNDPSLPGHNRDYLPMSLAYEFGQGQFKFEADWSLMPTAALGLGGAMLGDAPIVPANSPVISTGSTPGSVAAGGTLVIAGSFFGSTKDHGTVSISGKQMEVVSWSDTEIVVSIPLDAESGPLLVSTTTGVSNGVPTTVTAALVPAAFSAMSVPAAAIDVYVDASNAGPADGSAAKPWPTIGDALDNLPIGSLPGTTRNVFVAPGTYYERVTIAESDVRIIGAGPHETTVDGNTAADLNSQGVPNGGGPVFSIGATPLSGGVSNVTISGLTITGGSVRDEIGAGIFAGFHNRNIDINNNIIVRNGGYYGGGIWFHYSVHDVSIWSNTIAENGNFGGYGGGISVNDEPEDHSQPEHSEPEHIYDDIPTGPPPGTYEIYNNLIFHNLSADYGGGITLYEVKDRLEVYGNMIVENVALDHGGAMFAEDSGPIRVYDNVFLRNFSPDDGGAVSFEDVGDTVFVPGAAHQVEVFNNLFAENIADDHGENHARGGALALDDTFDAVVRNNTFVGNIVAGSEDPAGGAIDSERNGHEYNGDDAPLIEPGYSNPEIYNNIIWDNWKLEYDQPFHVEEEDLDYSWAVNYSWTPDQLHVDNPNLQEEWETAENSLSFTHVNNNVISCGYPIGAGNRDIDPKFADPAGFDWRLAADSPVIDMGVGISTLAEIPTGIMGALDFPVRDPDLSNDCPATPLVLPPGLSKDAASEPLNVSAVADEHRVVVSWTAPVSVGDSPIINYTVSSVPASAGCTTPDSATVSCEVTGLVNFTEYEFMVVANNASGAGPAGLVTATPTGTTCDTTADTAFTDISRSFAAAAVACIRHLGITTGTSTATYSPYRVVPRDEMAAFLVRLWETLSNTSPDTSSPFTDISGSFARSEIGFIFNLDITTGTSATKYSPSAATTREQAAAFLARTWRALGGACDGSATPFTDIAGSFAAADIACIYNLDITTGTSATKYSPNRSVTREQVAAFVARLWQAAINWDL